MDNKSQPRQRREEKRAQFSESAQARSKLTPLLAAALLLLVAVAAYLVWSNSSDQPAASTLTGASKEATEEIKIPLADLSGTAKFFNYTLPNDKPVRFFVVKSSDGVYRAALDACDVCYHARKGYRQQGDEMVCNNCGLKFPSALINEVSGGCNPVGLPRVVEGDHLVIKVSELESRSQYF